MMNIDKLPVEYRPLSPWAYFGYTLLFQIPIIGFIFLIVFSFSNYNINRRNFARSFFCVYVIVFIIAIIFGMFGGFAFLISMFN